MTAPTMPKIPDSLANLIKAAGYEIYDYFRPLYVVKAGISPGNAYIIITGTHVKLYKGGGLDEELLTPDETTTMDDLINFAVMRLIMGELE